MREFCQSCGCSLKEHSIGKRNGRYLRSCMGCGRCPIVEVKV